MRGLFSRYDNSPKRSIGLGFFPNEAELVEAEYRLLSMRGLVLVPHGQQPQWRIRSRFVSRFAGSVREKDLARLRAFASRS
jgi:hypothetical protein